MPNDGDDVAKRWWQCCQTMVAMLPNDGDDGDDGDDGEDHRLASMLSFYPGPYKQEVWQQFNNFNI